MFQILFDFFFVLSKNTYFYLYFIRFEKLYLGRKRFQTEGLNSLEYQRIALRRCKLFTWIYVELTPHIQENPFINIIRNSYFYKLFKG